MRYSIIAIAPFVAAAYAQSSETTESVAPTVVPVVSGDTTISSTYTYSNTLTNFLSETNSLGVVTGQPTLTNGGVAVTSQPELPAAITSQPEMATIPAGLPSGINTVYIGNGSSLSSFLVSVGSSTTGVVGGAVATDATLVTGSGVSAATGSQTGSGSSASSTGSSSDNNSDSSASGSGSSDEASNTSNNPSATGSSTASTSSSAADSIKLASGSLVGLGALFAALL